MAKVVLVRTKAGGSFVMSVVENYNFIASMKAARSDGAIITDQIFIPFDALDSAVLTDDTMTAPTPPKAEQN